MKKKKLKLFARILSIAMICCFAFLCVGCMGGAPGDYDEEGGGGGLDFDMYGAKVLYRPNSYDYDIGSGATGENQTNDYYGKYAWNILNALYRTYAIDDLKAKNDYLPNFSTNDVPYLYDSIRYKVDTVGTINSTRADTKAENGQISKGTPVDTNKTLIIADTSQNWNWSFDYDLNENIMDAMLVPETLKINNKIYKTFLTTTLENKILESYKDTIEFQPSYESIYLGADDAGDYEEYSEYVKALEYVIYCYALDLEPAEVRVSINDNVSEQNPDYYTVQIGMYSPTSEKSSVDVALEDIKGLWQKLGSYVGLVQRQINKISDWVLTNVIGWNNKITNDTFYRYSSVTEVTTTDHLGNITVSYEFNEALAGQPDSSSDLGRNYENAVNKILEAVCDIVTIGKDGEQDLTIDNRFLASEVKEYWGNTFMIAGDENFPKYEEGQSSVAIQPLEYQSVAIMLKDTITIDEVWVALKYDADLDGTEEGVWDENKYLDIIVELNFFSHVKKKMFTLGSQKTRVYDGPYDLVEIPSWSSGDHGTIMFTNLKQNCNDPDINDLFYGDPGLESLVVNGFNPDIGNGILKTDVGLSGYIGLPLVSRNPLVLVGTTDVRKYYQVLEPTEDELKEMAENQTYITGRFNEEMFKGSDGCDYLEITYKVLKTKGDADTNYKFYTGLAAIWDGGY